MKYGNGINTAFSGDIKKTILELLLEGPKTSGEIADKLQIKKSAVKKIEETGGREQLKKLIKSIADDIVADIKERIEKNNDSGNFEKSLKMLNSLK